MNDNALTYVISILDSDHPEIDYDQMTDHLNSEHSDAFVQFAFIASEIIAEQSATDLTRAKRSRDRASKFLSAMTAHLLEFNMQEANCPDDLFETV